MLRIGQKPAVQTSVTTDGIMKQAMEHISAERAALYNRKNIALSAFRRTADELGHVNQGLQATVDKTADMMAYLAEMKKASEKEINDNTIVRSRILEIIGE